MFQAEMDGVALRAAIHHHVGRTSSGAVRNLPCDSADCAIVLADSPTTGANEFQVQDADVAIAAHLLRQVLQPSAPVVAEYRDFLTFRLDAARNFAALAPTDER